MTRLVTVTVRSLFVLVGIAGVAGGQEPPALEPPALEAPRASAAQPPPEPGPKPVAPKPAVAPRGGQPPAPAVPARPEARPMLAIPGVTAPASRPRGAMPPGLTRPSQPTAAPLAPLPDALPPPLTGPPGRTISGAGPMPGRDSPPSPSLDALPAPSELPPLRRPASSAGIPQPGTIRRGPSVESIPLTVEPMGDEFPGDLRPSGPSTTSRSPNVRLPEDRTRDKLDDESTGPRPAPRRAPGLLGRLFGPPPPPPEPSSREESRVSPRRESASGSRPDPDSDRDPDVAARRRIERQIRATLGDKVRSFDVRITGRNVVITAQPSRFWLRRSVRRSLETLPVLQGYRSRIEITD